MRRTASPPSEPHLRQLSPSCNPNPIFRDITTITSGFGVVTAGPEHHILIADNPIMATVVFPPLRHHYRYMKTSTEGLPQALPTPAAWRSPVVAVTPTRTFPCLPPSTSGIPSLTTSPPFLPSDFSAVRRDMISWALWLFLATLIRTLMSAHRILYPRMLLIGITSAVLIQMTAWCVTWRFWPWASTRVMPFIIVAGAGFMIGSCFLDLTTEVHLLPWTASVAGSVIAVAGQWGRRLRWRARARRRLEPAS